MPAILRSTIHSIHTYTVCDIVEQSTPLQFATGRCIVSPRNAVYVTALPCKILIMTLPICLYMFTTINNNTPYKNICTLDITHVQK